MIEFKDEKVKEFWANEKRQKDINIALKIYHKLVVSYYKPEERLYVLEMAKYLLINLGSYLEKSLDQYKSQKD
jgi:hypothetical protein